MRRPGHAYLVVIAEQAEAVFADRDEASDYAAPHGEWAHVQQVPWWPSGSWRYGITTSSHTTSEGLVPHAVLDARDRHTGTNQRCVGADIDVVDGPYGGLRYHCANCANRIY